MKKLTLAFVMIAPMLLMPADLSFAGRSNENLAGSDIGGSSLRFEQTSGREVRVTGVVVANATFKIDGRDHPVEGRSSEEGGESVAWTQLDGHTWTAINKIDGSIATSDRVTLSADERTLTINRTGTAPNGPPTETFVFSRVSGRMGLLGEWLMKSRTVP